MSDLSDLIRHRSGERLARLMSALDVLAPQLAEAAERILETCLQGHRVYLCPQRDTLPLAEQMTGLLLRGALQPRPGLPVILLPPLFGDTPACGLQISGLASPGDLLFALGGERHKGLETLVECAHEQGVHIVLFGANLPEHVIGQLRDDDLLIGYDATCPLTLRQTQMASVHALCEALDHRLLGLA